MKKVALLLTTCLLCACNDMKDRLQTGDLVFVSKGESAFSKAISASTADSLTSYTHVGIIDCEDDGNIYVIEASSENGVVMTPLDSFKTDDKQLDYYRVVSGEIDPEEIILKAKKYIGQPYDYFYLPDNGKMYCSELVYECYLDPEGKPIFKSQPMNFRDEDGNMPQFWIELFQKNNMEIPEGVPGTNPNDLSKSEKITKLCIK